MNRKLLTTKELAEELRISYAVANKLLRDGKIIASKIGGGWRIQSDAVERYIKQVSNENRAQGE